MPHAPDAAFLVNGGIDILGLAMMKGAYRQMPCDKRRSTPISINRCRQREELHPNDFDEERHDGLISSMREQQPR